MSRAAAPHHRAQQSGAYVHMTSTSGLIGGMGQANYAAAKMGIDGLSRSISIDMEQARVRANFIAPFAFRRMIGAIDRKSGVSGKSGSVSVDLGGRGII